MPVLESGPPAARTAKKLADSDGSGEVEGAAGCGAEVEERRSADDWALSENPTI